MEKELRVRYLYNCGVMLSYGDTSILIDTLFEKNNGFDEMPEMCETAIFEKRAPFENVSGLLFTHCHADHYSVASVERYCRMYPETVILSPETLEERREEMPKGAPRKEIRCGDFAISCIETGHIPTGKDEGPHYIYVICAGGRQIVLSGDMDPVKLPEVAEAYGSSADMFFINPAMLLYEMKNGETTLLKRVKNLYVYHLASEAGDRLGYRRMTLGSLGRIRRHLGDITLLLENGEEWALDPKKGGVEEL